MPQSVERKREYNKLRQRRLRGYGGGESERGVVPDVVPQIGELEQSVRMLSPLEKGNVVPEQMFCGGMERIRFESWDNETGGYLGRKWAWVTRRTKMVAPSRQQIIEYMGILAESGLRLADGPHYRFVGIEAMRVMEQRIMQVEADLARLEAMLDSVLSETREEYGY